LVNFCFLNYGNDLTVKMLDELKDLGFIYATKAGISIGIDDMVIPSRKGDIVDGARKAVLEVERQRLDGAITAGERHNKIIDIWHRATEQVSHEMFSEMARAEADRKRIQSHLHDGRLRSPRIEGAACWYARSDVQTLG
jgi:DNA-directed RNA polymerase subunit beta'